MEPLDARVQRLKLLRRAAAREGIRLGVIDPMTGKNQHDMRWIAEATEEHCTRALRDRDAEIIEWPEFMGVTWVCSVRQLCIVRARALGGDVRAVDVGFAYDNPISLVLDRSELRRVPMGVITPGRGSRS